MLHGLHPLDIPLGKWLSVACELIQTAILKCIDDQNDWSRFLDSIQFQFAVINGKYKDVSNDSDVYMWAHVAFPNDRHSKIPHEAPIDVNADSMLKAIHAISAIWDHSHKKVDKNIKLAQKW